MPGRRGRAAVDREIYVPRSRADQSDRCRAVGLDRDTTFATKPEPAARMIARFLDAGHHASWRIRRRGLRRQPGTADHPGGTQHRPCARGGPPTRNHHQGGEVPGGHPDREVPRASLAEAVGRSRSQGVTRLRLGPHRPVRAPTQPPPSADPPQPHHRRTRLLPLLFAPTGAAGDPDRCRGIKMAARGDVPVRKGAGRTGRASGPPLHVLSAPGHPRHARPRLPRRRPYRGTHARTAPDNLVPLTCNEIQHLGITLVVRPSRARHTGSPGPTGDAATRHDPMHATIGGKPQPNVNTIYR